INRHGMVEGLYGPGAVELGYVTLRVVAPPPEQALLHNLRREVVPHELAALKRADPRSDEPGTRDVPSRFPDAAPDDMWLGESWSGAAQNKHRDPERNQPRERCPRY